MSANIFAMDLGTYDIKVGNKLDGKVYTEKNTVAILNKNQLFAYGNDAYAMYEKTPEHLQVAFPVAGGVIAEFGFLQTFIFDYLENQYKGKVRGAEYLVAVPTDITEVEKKAFFDLFYKSKSKPKIVQVCDKPIADAVGLGLNVNEPTGIMIVDIGADTTEISVISLGGLVISNLLHFGGNRLDEDIQTHIKRMDNLVIGKKTACQLKENIGWAMPGHADSLRIVGRDIESGLPIEVDMTSDMIYDAMAPDLSDICNAVKGILEHTPPEVARDIIRDGIFITGGGSQIKGLRELFQEISGIQVNLAEDPNLTVVNGLLKISSDSAYKHLAYNLNDRMYE